MALTCLPYGSRTGGHNEHAQLRVICELMQNAFAFGCWTLAINTFECPRTAGCVCEIVLEQIQRSCPTGEDNAALSSAYFRYEVIPSAPFSSRYVRHNISHESLHLRRPSFSSEVHVFLRGEFRSRCLYRHAPK
jgi:hypothetical protein